MTISKLFIDHFIIDHPWAMQIQSRLNIAPHVVYDARIVFDWVSTKNDPIAQGKRVLFLTRNKGAFIKKCPGTQCYTCCDYQILHIGTYCIMDCSYCILQSYFHPPVLQFFVNSSDLFSELDGLFSEKIIRRIGTGEFTDSLIWEQWINLSEILVERFGDQRFTVLELKTKTTAIENLENLRHNGKTILAWSLNTERIIHSEERGTASLSARLSAAARCQAWGYPLAFHFDPMVIYNGCEADYKNVIKQLFSAVCPENIVWISLGSFRFMPSLKPIIRQRFSHSKIPYGEFIPGMDGKMRYFKPLRIEIYRKMVSYIREYAPNACIYFCMEDDDVWGKSLGFLPSEHGGLPQMLDKSAIAHCGLEAVPHIHQVVGTH